MKRKITRVNQLGPDILLIQNIYYTFANQRAKQNNNSTHKRNTLFTHKHCKLPFRDKEYTFKREKKTRSKQTQTWQTGCVSVSHELQCDNIPSLRSSPPADVARFLPPSLSSRSELRRESGAPEYATFEMDVDLEDTRINGREMSKP